MANSHDSKYYTPHILLRSIDRVQGSSDNCVLNLNGAGIYGKYLLKSVSLPNTVYSIRSTNNTIYFTQSATNYVATITAGYYTSSSITTAIATAMNAVGAAGTFSAAFLASLGTISITNSTTAFSLTFGTNKSNSAAYPLGFSLVDTASATTQTASNVLQLSPMSITILIGGRGSILNYANQSQVGIYIPLQVGFGSLNIFTPANEFRQFIYFDSPANSLTLQIYDSANNPVSLNGGDFEILMDRLTN